MKRDQKARLPEVVMVRLPAGTLARLEAIAETEGARASAVTRRFVLEGLRRYPATAVRGIR